MSGSLRANHHTICKFKSPTDTQYVRVRNTISHFAREASPAEAPAVDVIDRIEDSQKIAAILGVHEDTEDDLKSRHGRIMDGTGQWLLQKSDFTRWKSSVGDRAAPVFWLFGLPASGKTALSSMVAHHLKDQQASCQHHFFSTGHQTKRTAAYCLRSIASQLAQKSQPFREALFSFHDETGIKFTSQDQNFRTIWEKVFEGIIFKIAFTQPLFWIIDGIDEADLHSLVINSLLRIRSTTTIKVFLSSRPMKVPTATKGEGSPVTVRFLAETDTARDIRAYVATSIRDILAAAETVQQDIVDKILAKASGSFLWVRLCLKSLRQSCHTRDDIDKALTGLPAGMVGLYEQMLAKLLSQPEKTQSLAHMLLSWVSCSWRPLRLEELQLALEPTFTGFLNLEDTVNQICAHFVTTDNEDDPKWLQSWAIDLIRLVGKFGFILLAKPPAIYRDIIPFCPKGSMFTLTYGERKAGELTVTGLPSDGWDDRLARVSVGDEYIASQAQKIFIGKSTAPDVLVRPDEHDMEDESSLDELSLVSSEPTMSQIDNTKAFVSAIASSGSDAYYCCGRDDGSVIIHEVAIGTPIRKVYTHSSTTSVLCMKWSPSGRYMVSSDDSARVIAKRLESKAKDQWRVYPVLDARVSEPVHQFVFSPDEQYLLISTSSTDQLYDTRSKERLWFKDWGSRQRRCWVQDPLDMASLIWLEPQLLTSYQWSTMSIQVSVAIESEPELEPEECSEPQKHDHIEKVVVWAEAVPSSGQILYGTLPASHYQGVVSQLSHSGLHVEAIRMSRTIESRIASFRPECTPELARRAKRLVGITKGRVAYLDHDNQLCTWDLDSGIDGMQKHFFLPRDWLDTSSLETALINEEGTFFCPKGGYVAVVRNGLSLHTMSTPTLLEGFPGEAPSAPSTKLRYADVAITATAKEFAGIYRGKQYHEPDFDAVLDRALAAGVEKIMLTGMYASDASFNLDIARHRPEQCRVTIGVHPYHAVEADEGGEEYYKGLSDSITTTMIEEPHLLAAFGELGLDYDKLAEAPKDVQIRVFKRQLDMIVSAGWKLPLFLHCRAAFEDFVAILEPYMDRLPLRSGLVHSFVGTTAQMQSLIGMGLHLSVNNFAIRDRDSLDMIRHVPLDKLQIETDAPWGDIQASSDVAKAYLKKTTKWSWGSKKKDKFTMGDMVKERNESCNVEKVALVVAGIKGVAVEEVAESTWRNSVGMFFLR
ncbi:uncharacterized protein J4E79_011458 [Alternaria viburni]|uniref:uncharacterized protein n=1 Tax=Alternaria viburni TaxID=566460 RepID=UPI0020C46BAE|nr:uncharacterized protein J4E79_011458 [Alternaria viburni]KAI4642576.1 hypothetical protein J4E79_011458 [Alternaria viburni]